MSYVEPFLRGDFTDCIHCGLCLEACPTYRESLEEGLSARGRIHVLELLARGELTPTGENPRALDLCLLCCACQAACPSGVRYLDLMTKARGWLPRVRRLRRERRALRWMRLLFLHPRLLSLVLRSIRLAARSGLAALIVRLFFARRHHRHFLDLIASLTVTNETPTPASTAEVPARAPVRTPADAGPRSTDATEVLLFRGCATPALFPGVLRALESLLRKAGVSYRYPLGQGCCGALLLHHGDLESTRTLARRNVDAFAAAGDEPIVSEAAGCGAVLKEYGRLLADDPDYAERARAFAARVQDATEYFAARLKRAPPAPQGSEVRVVYQDPCHLRHLQEVSADPRALLERMPSLRRVAVGEADLCCGSAGIYNLLEPEMSAGLAARKVALLRDAEADLVATANPGCRLQLAGRLQREGLPMRHVVEICDLYWPPAGADGPASGGAAVNRASYESASDEIGEGGDR